MDDADLVNSMEVLDLTDCDGSEREAELVDSVNLKTTSEEELETDDLLQKSKNIVITDSVKSVTIESRVDLLCNELIAFSKLKDELTIDQKDKLSKSCMSLFITLSRKSKN